MTPEDAERLVAVRRDLEYHQVIRHYEARGDLAFLLRLLDEVTAERDQVTAERDAARNDLSDCQGVLRDLIEDRDGYEVGRQAGYTEGYEAAIVDHGIREDLDAEDSYGEPYLDYGPDSFWPPP